jgi:hypothetical protein
VRSSSTRRKPAVPARKLQSHSPTASLVAMNAISMRPMNSIIFGVNRSLN